jgi:hypothetical protein
MFLECWLGDVGPSERGVALGSARRTAVPTMGQPEGAHIQGGAAGERRVGMLKGQSFRATPNRLPNS